MKTEHIKYILTVANSKSINKASAKLCNYPAQKLSRIICAIEEELNCKIFSKNNKGISITEEGRFVLEKFQEIENILQELEMHKHLINNEELACKTSGKLNIYSLVSNKNTYSFHAIKNFAKDYPNIRIIKVRIKPQRHSHKKHLCKLILSYTIQPKPDHQHNGQK